MASGRRRFRIVVAVIVAPAGCGTGEGVESPALPAAQEAFLDTLQERTFGYFRDLTNPSNGLVPDRWPTRSFSSVAAVGFGLTALPIAVERGWLTRTEAASRVRTTLAFLWNAPRSAEPAGVTGHMGFFYHFLDMETGHRYQTVELSTIDTALLIAGALVCAEYFTGNDAVESEIRALADSLYRRIDWTWAQPRPPLVSMGWTPEQGFHGWDWRGYNEAMLLYVLALGSPTHAIDPAAWAEWTSTYVWGEFHGQTHINFSPLFGHQYSHIWIDFRDIRDSWIRARGIDYFENARRAVLSQRAYAIANPMGWQGYGEDAWGLTASDGPVDTTLEIGGQERRFRTYSARGASLLEIVDDGTLAPTALGGSIPFAPELTIATLLRMRERHGEPLFGQYGFLDAFNMTLTQPIPVQHGRVIEGEGWYDTDYLGIDQGPIVAMIENYRTGLIWRLMRGNEYIRNGLRRAGFTGGWLDDAEAAR
ncbi:MAG: glucoamylase family protein [Longimicrobiales bacterium]